uniref:Secreted protein n=1 Tax=Rhizophora mucronata TaxID=61149 RepID=A0A2P2ISI4_RHIMU
MMFRSLMRLAALLIREPASSVTTILYHSELLPQDVALERLVRRDLLDEENYLFHFLVNFLRCFWSPTLLLWSLGP